MNNNVYIKSIEASDIYNENYRDNKVKARYIGMMPDSLTLRKLITLKNFHVKKIKKDEHEKLISNDIINVKYNLKVNDIDNIIKSLNCVIDNTKNDMNNIIENLFNICNKEKVKELNEKYKKLESYIEKLYNYIVILETKNNLFEKCGFTFEQNVWDELTANILRDLLYRDGFKLFDLDYETGKVTNEINYSVWQRSSAKSRIGNILFIKNELYDEMIRWQRMDINIPEDKKVDLCSLLAYESLASSSIIDVIEINPKNILLIEDKESIFDCKVDIVQNGDKGHLINKSNVDSKINNVLFDGEVLLDKKVFDENKSIKGKGFCLLRQRFFKAAAFNANVQDFLKDHCPADIPYNEFKVKNKFGEEMFAYDVLMVCTESSLKALKFSEYVSDRKSELLQQRDMFDYWKKQIAKDGYLFGCCKYEKPSKRGYDDNGNIVNQMSYQFFNSINGNYNSINTICAFEKDYINKLKTDKQTFIDHLKNNANDVNSNDMIIDLYDHNNDILDIKMLKNYKNKQVFNYVEHVKHGKPRLTGDYCIMCGNGLSMLYHIINQFDVNNPPEGELEDNQVHTKLHAYDKEYLAFRSPHTSPSNVCIIQNKASEEHYDKYFNSTNGIIFVNAIKFPIQDVLSGCDYDSDQILVIDNSTLLSNAKTMLIDGSCRVCLNKVPKSSASYFLNSESMSKIDNKLSQSQHDIGTVVDYGQLFMSMWWDDINNGIAANQIYFDMVQICTILSSISIDNAKRTYDLDISKEIEYIESQISANQKKAQFFKYVGKKPKNKDQAKKKKNPANYNSYKCPMDYLQTVMENLDSYDGITPIDYDLLLNKPEGYAESRKRRKIEEHVNDMVKVLQGIEADYKGKTDDESKEEKFVLQDECMIEFKNKINKVKNVNQQTMFYIVENLMNTHDSCLRALNILYKSKYKNEFLNCFKQQIA